MNSYENSKNIGKSMKNKEISEDEEKKYEKEVQNFTDKHIKIIDDKVPPILSFVSYLSNK